MHVPWFSQREFQIQSRHIQNNSNNGTIDAFQPFDPSFAGQLIPHAQFERGHCACSIKCERATICSRKLSSQKHSMAFVRRAFVTHAHVMRGKIVITGA